MCISGYWHVRNLSREQIDTLSDDIGNGLSPQYLKLLTKEYNLIIVAGLIQKAPNGALYNTYVAAQPDGCVHSHRKLHCFISRHMSSHQDYTDFDSHLGVRIGILVCYDNNLVENASKGPNRREWLLRWLPSRAHDNGMFILFSNGVGRDDDELRTGNAMIIDCYGRILAKTWKAENNMVIAELDLTLLDRCTGRRWLRARRPKLCTRLAKSTGKELSPREARFSQDSTE